MEEYQKLEKEFGESIGNPNCVAVSSGTTALHIALVALEMPKSTSVVMSDFTMIACARAATLAGLRPTFVDCDDSLLIDTAHLLETVEKDTSVRAVMPVHIYGRRCNMGNIAAIAKQHSLRVIEDLAELHGVNPHPLTDAACWSFYKNKVIHGEEGGMVAFRSPEDASRARRIRSLGSSEVGDFDHAPGGVNGRMSNAHAKLIRESFAVRKSNYSHRSSLAEEYNRHIPILYQMPVRLSPWVYDVRLPGLQRDAQDAIVRHLRHKGIEARHGFKPMSSQQEYRGAGLATPNAYLLSREIVYLPLPEGIDVGDVAGICEEFAAALRSAGYDGPQPSSDGGERDTQNP